MATVPNLEEENTQVGHARFIAEASSTEKWKDGIGNPGKGGEEATGRELKGMNEGQGKLLPTSSHLFKLILPLNLPSSPSTKTPPPTVFLLHPSQPLSHLARLIGSGLSTAIPAISFRSVSPDEPHNDEVEWSESTDIGDFIKNAVAEEHFSIVLTPSENMHSKSTHTQSAKLSSKERKASHPNSPIEHHERVITVQIPSFRDRTQFLRRRLRVIDLELHQMEQLKDECDNEAHRGAQRMALGGFGMLIVYWLGVARLTFYDYGWDVMEPITYLSGLSTVICGYLWFLYKGREVSYSSVLRQSVSKRRDALYNSRGLDIDRWVDLVAERKALRREMNKIAEDYDVRWDGKWDGKWDGQHKARETAARDEDRDAEKKRLDEETNGEGKDDEGEDKKIDKLGKEAREDQERHS